MTFPRLAIHTGNKGSRDNRHPEWEGTITLQHNETTATILKYGPNMTRGAKKRHPLLSTFQSNCEGEHWAPFNADHQFAMENDVWTELFFGQEVKDGLIVVPPSETTVSVAPPVAH